MPSSCGFFVIKIANEINVTWSIRLSFDCFWTIICVIIWSTLKATQSQTHKSLRLNDSTCPPKNQSINQSTHRYSPFILDYLPDKDHLLPASCAFNTHLFGIQGKHIVNLSVLSSTSLRLRPFDRFRAKNISKVIRLLMIGTTLKTYANEWQLTHP